MAEPLTFRPAVREDFSVLEIPLTARVSAVAGFDENGEIAGVGGIAYRVGGLPYAFTNLKPRALMSPVSLHRCALRVMAKAREDGVEKIIACADLARSPAAERWLSRLGFVKTHDMLGNPMWIWEAKIVRA